MAASFTTVAELINAYHLTSLTERRKILGMRAGGWSTAARCLEAVDFKCFRLVRG